MLRHTAGCVNHHVFVAISDQQVMFSASFVCLLYCQQHYAKLLKPFSWNLLERIWAKEEPINLLEQIWVKGRIQEFPPHFFNINIMIFFFFSFSLFPLPPSGLKKVGAPKKKKRKKGWIMTPPVMQPNRKCDNVPSVTLNCQRRHYTTAFSVWKGVPVTRKSIYICIKRNSARMWRVKAICFKGYEE